MVSAESFGLDTPRTDAGNATFLSQHEFDITQEPSFHQPEKPNELVKQMRGGSGKSLFRTPGKRRPLGEKQNPPATKTEFTPLMRSVTKANYLKAQTQARIETPAALKDGALTTHNTPALPMNSSVIYDGDNTSSSVASAEAGSTPVPQLMSSSAASTPLAALPRRDGGGTLADNGQMMTLREQENVR
jgi:hypothetical protein